MYRHFSQNDEKRGTRFYLGIGSPAQIAAAYFKHRA
jgi:hypothetical protein